VLLSNPTRFTRGPVAGACASRSHLRVSAFLTPMQVVDRIVPGVDGGEYIYEAGDGVRWRSDGLVFTPVKEPYYAYTVGV
jgi:hypothetical protein